MAPGNDLKWFDQRKPDKQSGFTLIEIMIVTVIISILVAASVPRILQELPDHRLKSAARALYSTLQRARLLATKENSDIAVFFDTATGNYQVLRDWGPDATWGTADDINDGPGPDLTHGNGDDVPEEAPVPLTSHGNSIAYGTGAATTNATQNGGSLPGNAVSYVNSLVVFNSRGFLRNAGFNGYVYLSNSRNTCFALGTPTVTGNIVLRRWDPNGAAWTTN
ncbi:MAG: type II secretion system protein [Desulfobacteraceae bacterium]|nr:type II secretion system protein [Desulfobacteraceae bacterium]